MGKCGRPNLDPVAVICRPIAKTNALARVDLAPITVMGVHFVISFQTLDCKQEKPRPDLRGLSFKLRS